MALAEFTFPTNIAFTTVSCTGLSTVAVTPSGAFDCYYVAGARNAASIDGFTKVGQKSVPINGVNTVVSVFQPAQCDNTNQPIGAPCPIGAASCTTRNSLASPTFVHCTVYTAIGVPTAGTTCTTIADCKPAGKQCLSGTAFFGCLTVSNTCGCSDTSAACDSTLAGNAGDADCGTVSLSCTNGVVCTASTNPFLDGKCACAAVPVPVKRGDSCVQSSISNPCAAVTGCDPATEDPIMKCLSIAGAFQCNCQPKQACDVASDKPFGPKPNCDICGGLSSGKISSCVGGTCGICDTRKNGDSCVPGQGDAQCQFATATCQTTEVPSCVTSSLDMSLAQCKCVKASTSSSSTSTSSTSTSSTSTSSTSTSSTATSTSSVSTSTSASSSSSSSTGSVSSSSSSTASTSTSTSSLSTSTSTKSSTSASSTSTSNNGNNGQNCYSTQCKQLQAACDAAPACGKGCFTNVVAALSTKQVYSGCSEEVVYNLNQQYAQANATIAACVAMACTVYSDVAQCTGLQNAIPAVVSQPVYKPDPAYVAPVCPTSVVATYTYVSPAAQYGAPSSYVAPASYMAPSSYVAPAQYVAPSNAPAQYVAPSNAPAQYVAPSNAPAQYVAPNEPIAQYVAPATWTPCTGSNCNQNIYVAGAKTAAAGLFSAVVVLFF